MIIPQRVFRILIIISTTLAMSACLTLGTVEIEVIQPAKITVPSNINSILIVNNSLTYPIDSFTNDIQKGLFQLDTTTTQLLAYQVNEVLNESPRFDSSKLVNDIYFRKAEDLLQPIEWNGVNSLCSQFEVDALLSLEAFGIHDTIVKTSYYDGYSYYSYSNLVLIVNSMWRIYLKEEKQILEKRIHRDTIYLDEISSKRDYLRAITQPRAINYLADKIAINVSTQIADRMAPYWLPIQRDLFIHSNKQMQQAAKLAYKDNWRDAAQIWKLLTENENKKIAAGACHNMALVCEVEGKFDIALIWLEESLEINDSFTSREYYKQIQLRIKNSAKLDEQFGINNE